MRTVHYYDAETGLFQATFSTTDPAFEEAVELNSPQGCRWKEGRFDPLSQRVDLASDSIVDYQPTRPDENHDWDEGSNRWRLRNDAVERSQRRAQAKAQIGSLEQRQLRPLRELAVNPDDETARLRLMEIEEQILVLRAQL